MRHDGERASDPAKRPVEHEDPAQIVEATGPVTMTPCPGGPLLVRGDFELATPEGTTVPKPRRTVALCRCGKSTITPFCDGTHKLVDFQTDD